VVQITQLQITVISITSITNYIGLKSVYCQHCHCQSQHISHVTTCS